jgi:hypothetical protein
MRGQIDMSEDLESRLRAALRPVAPSDDFAQDLIARVAAEQRPQSTKRGFGWHRPGAPAWWLSASIAASLLVAVGLQHQLQERRERERGLEARRQVIEALRVTSQKLNLAFVATRSQSSSLADEEPGA